MMGSSIYNEDIGKVIRVLSNRRFGMIYCVEDDKSILDLMIYTLKAAGFEAKGCSCADEFYKSLEAEKPQLVILDIMLPGDDGISILKRIREEVATSDIPVIMASARGSEFDKVSSLDAGADDYLVKPFGMMEMVSRVKAVLRRTDKPGSENDEIKCGPIVLNRREYWVTVGDQQIELTRKEFELLELLMENPEQVFTREQLLAQIWGMDFLGETRTVDVHIGTLRTKLGENRSYIKTVRGIGYKLNAQG